MSLETGKYLQLHYLEMQLTIHASSASFLSSATAARREMNTVYGQ